MTLLSQKKLKLKNTCYAIRLHKYVRALDEERIFDTRTNKLIKKSVWLHFFVLTSTNEFASWCAKWYVCISCTSYIDTETQYVSYKKARDHHYLSKMRIKTIVTCCAEQVLSATAMAACVYYSYE